MTYLDLAQIIFLAIVVTIGLGGIIKVVFFDKDDDKS